MLTECRDELLLFVRVEVIERFDVLHRVDGVVVRVEYALLPRFRLL